MKRLRLCKWLSSLIFVCVLAVMTLFATIASASSGWLIYHEGAFKGKVIDAETKEPIEGAVVVAIYRIREYSFVQSDAAVADVKEILTDKNGEFTIPPHTFFSIYPVAKGETTLFIVFKPGYAAVSDLNLREILSGERAQEREVPWVYNQDRKFIFAPGLIGLPKVKTREERLNAMPSPVEDSEHKSSWYWHKQRQFIRLLNEENKNLGVTGQYKD